MASATNRIVVDGAQLVDFRSVVRDMRKLHGDLPKVISKANKLLATEVADIAKARVSSIPGAASSKVRSQATKGIRPRGGQRYAAVALLGSNPFVRAFEFGARYHFLPWVRASGQSGFVRVSTLRRAIYPPWVGNKFDGGDWKDGVHGKQGHLIAPAIEKGLRSGDFLDHYYELLDTAFAHVFPEAA